MSYKTQHPINAGIDAAIRSLISKAIASESVNASDFDKAITLLRDILRAAKPGTQDEHYQTATELLSHYTNKGSALLLSGDQVKSFLFEVDELRVVYDNLVKLTSTERFLIEALRNGLADMLTAESEMIDIIATKKHLAESHWSMFFAGTHQRCPYAYAAITKYTAEVHRQERMNRWQLAWFIDRIEELLDRAAISAFLSDEGEECFCPGQFCIEQEACNLSVRLNLSPSDSSINQTCSSGGRLAGSGIESIDQLEILSHELYPPLLTLFIRPTAPLQGENERGFQLNVCPIRSGETRHFHLNIQISLGSRD